ncbi:exodeoxyribonuclease VII small subunit [Ilyobacter polytropus]|uniref:Exodeoxyribonuclease 7 small subunit n=1 Tax=Ilyobacter polytropus (strain ATCC 51220 / DSM 2926 / LMG 16218 / CuHBu1) TaxID=572544 RepID=E3HAN2_ILYPC|nr:exodeoxyribonuclease VII small subunit [Ilyobacter polytropus]ADO83219.1 Exodeoxyribonuclease VII small subunit [Ilyobacter polytropus DSM 2926]
MAKVKTFEENLVEVDEVISKLESGDMELSASIKEYEKAMKLLKKSSDMLEKAEGKIMKVIEENGEIKLEEF